MGDRLAGYERGETVTGLWCMTSEVEAEDIGMTRDAAPPVPRKPAAPAFPVVVVAASAGGIEALGQIFGA